MGVREKTLQLFRSGMSPREISRERGVNIKTTLQYLEQLVGRGLLRRSDIYFSIPPEQRQKLREEWKNAGCSGSEFVERLRRGGREKDSDDARVVVNYGDARDALGDMYDDLWQIEVFLHERLRRALQDKCPTDWWGKLVPPNVREECESRHKNDPKPAAEPYAYTDLMHLHDIIQQRWTIVKDHVLTEATVHNRDRIVKNLKELNRIRRIVMHPSRGIKPEEKDFEFVRLFKKKLCFGDTTPS